MTTLLITGSRQASPAMLEYARRVVLRAAQLEWGIVVGDAEGIDAVVMEECHRQGVRHIIYGAYGRLRRKTASGSLNAISGTYPERDELMAQLCDCCIAIWDGKSSGTRITFTAARRFGKQTWVMIEQGGKMQEQHKSAR